MDDTSPETDSNLYKIVRAVDGDTKFRLRSEMALEISGKKLTRSNLVHIAMTVVDSIICTVEGTVNTSNVTDQMIMEAIDRIPESTDPAN